MTLNMTRPVQCDLGSRYIGHFFSSFLCSNNLSGNSSDSLSDVRLLLHDSPGLRNAITAVAAMDIRCRSLAPARSAKGVALCYYRAAISSVQTELVDCDVIANDSVLWSTFFLGIFEVSASVCFHAGRQPRANR